VEIHVIARINTKILPQKMVKSDPIGFKSFISDVL